MSELRSYQRALSDETVGALEEPGASAMLQLPTGGGKSLIAADVVVRRDRLYNCWLTHRRELRQQATKHLHDAGLTSYVMGDLPSARREWRPHEVAILSPGLRSLPPLPRRVGTMVADEAHHTPASSWARVVEDWRTAGGCVVGPTATPWRMRRSQGFRPWYNVLICGPTVRELQSLGWLATPHVIIPSEAQMDCAAAEIARTGDYSFRWMESETLALLAQRPVVDIHREHTSAQDDPRTLWFLPTVPSARAILELLPDAAGLFGDTPAHERDHILAALESGSLTNLVSVEVLGEGFDMPSVPNVATLRTTRSLVVWLQECGRAARPKSATGGTYSVLDYATNSFRFGPPDLDRTWSLDPRGPKTGGGRSPYDDATCVERCGAVLHPSSRACWQCGTDQYLECSECRVHRRWTAFHALHRSETTRTCEICHRYMAAAAARENRQRWAIRSYYRGQRSTPRRARVPAGRIAPYGG